jgi:integrase
MRIRVHEGLTAVIFVVTNLKGRCMQMPKRGENIYKRKDGRWEARVINGYNEQGKALYAYFYGRSYKEAKDKIFSPLVNINGATRVVNDSLCETAFNDLLDSWLKEKTTRLKKSSCAKYFNLVKNHIKPVLGHMMLTDISNSVIAAFVTEKSKSGRMNADGGLSGKSIKDILSLIKSALRYAKKEGFISTEIPIDLTYPQQKTKEMRVLTKEEQAVFEKYLCTDIDNSKLGILLCLYTGLRVGEICALTWDDISIDNSTLTVNRTVQRVQNIGDVASAKTNVLITEPKSIYSNRTIPVPDCLISILDSFKPALSNAYVLTGKMDYFIEPRTYQNRFKFYIAASGIRNANFHSLRHTFATRCVELGFEVKSLSEILGHSNVNITLNRYVHPSFDMKRLNMNKLTYLH